MFSSNIQILTKLSELLVAHGSDTITFNQYQQFVSAHNFEQGDHLVLLAVGSSKVQRKERGRGQLRGWKSKKGGNKRSGL